MYFTKRGLLLCAAATVGLAGGSTLALATPASDVSSTPAVIGDLPAHSKAKQDGIGLSTREAAKVASFALTFAPGGQSGWHAHPGVAIAVVEEGTVVRQVGCDTETFTKGQSFTEVEPHFVRNASTIESAVLRITHVYPDGATRRTETEPPAC
jgi:quercetin dioxygenase-like cupin family protein